MCMAGAFINDWCSDTWLTHGHNIDHGIKEHKNHANETKKAKRKAVKSCIEFILTKICQINGSHDISVHLSNRTLKCSCDLFVIKMPIKDRYWWWQAGAGEQTNCIMCVFVCVCASDTYSQQDLNGRTQHLDVLVVKETPGDSDDMVVIRGHARVQHRCYQATRAVLHPPWTMKRRVECHEEVPVLNTHRHTHTQ